MHAFEETYHLRALFLLSSVSLRIEEIAVLVETILHPSDDLWSRGIMDGEGEGQLINLLLKSVYLMPLFKVSLVFLGVQWISLCSSIERWIHTI
jgi:hypothetical protein